ncbi:hypothetical protein [Acidovorax sp. BL-A-41-H1]|uniref:hypothetical protein n=1 Tax=Acidovorax sp. BL-A-41-H1 TaxID=3421102 RepID=UPI003F78C672
MTDTTQPEAIKLAERISDTMCASEADARAIAAAADELLRLHARVTELEAQAPAVPAVPDAVRHALHVLWELLGETDRTLQQRPERAAKVRQAASGLEALFEAAPQPEAAAVKPMGYGGSTGINDYLMNDGTIKAMRPDEVVWAAPQPEAIQGLQSAHDVVTIELLNERVAYLEQQLEAMRNLLREVAACFTRDDDLPNNLLPRIDAALPAQGGV